MAGSPLAGPWARGSSRQDDLDFSHHRSPRPHRSNPRKDSSDSLLVDVGDVYQGTAESLQNGGKLMLDLFGRLGYDAWTLGNHDFDWGPEMQETNLRLSKSPVLTGNLKRDGSHGLALRG